MPRRGAAFGRYLHQARDYATLSWKVQKKVDLAFSGREIDHNDTPQFGGT